MKKVVKIVYESCVNYNNKIWFSAFNHNGLYCSNLNSEKIDIEFIGRIPNEKLYAFRLYASIQCIKDKIVLIPFEAKEIAVYDIQKNVFVKIKLAPAECFSNTGISKDEHKFWCSAVYDDCVYMFPHNYPAVVKLNVVDLTVSYITDIIRDIYSKSCNNECYMSDVYIEKNHAYLSCGCANVWVEFNFEDESFKVNDIEYIGNGYNAVLKYRNKLWFSPRCSNFPIISVNLNNFEESVYDNFPQDFFSSGVPFHTIIPFKDNVVFIPATANQFLVLNILTDDISNLEMLTSLLKNRNKKYYSYDAVLFCALESNKLTFISGYDYNLYVVDLCTGKIDILINQISSDYPIEENLPTGIFDVATQKTIGENNGLNIDLLFEILKTLKNNESTEEKTTACIGKIIYTNKLK